MSSVPPEKNTALALHLSIRALAIRELSIRGLSIHGLSIHDQ
jgi:hypothetical protein